VGSAILSCTSSNGTSSCSATGTTQSAGTLLYMVWGPSGDTSAPTGSAAVAFSCQ
jgi:hypothetical protein